MEEIIKALKELRDAANTLWEEVQDRNIREYIRGYRDALNNIIKKLEE